MAAGTWLRYPSSPALLVSNDMSWHRRYLVSRGLHQVLRLQQHQCEENKEETRKRDGWFSLHVDIKGWTRSFPPTICWLFFFCNICFCKCRVSRKSFLFSKSILQKMYNHSKYWVLPRYILILINNKNKAKKIICFSFFFFYIQSSENWYMYLHIL